MSEHLYTHITNLNAHKWWFVRHFSLYCLLIDFALLPLYSTRLVLQVTSFLRTQSSFPIFLVLTMTPQFGLTHTASNQVVLYCSAVLLDDHSFHLAQKISNKATFSLFQSAFWKEEEALRVL